MMNYYGKKETLNKLKNKLWSTSIYSAIDTKHKLITQPVGLIK